MFNIIVKIKQDCHYICYNNMHLKKYVALVSSPLFYIGCIFRKSYIHTIWDSIRIRTGEVISETRSITRLHNIYRWLRLIKFVTSWFEIREGRRGREEKMQRRYESRWAINEEKRKSFVHAEYACSKFSLSRIHSRMKILCWLWGEENRTEWWGCLLKKVTLFIQRIESEIASIKQQFMLLSFFLYTTSLNFITITFISAT